MSGLDNDGKGIPPRLYRFLATTLGPAAGVVFLCLSTLLIPVGMAAHFLIRSPDLADSINWIGVWACGC